MPWRPHVLNADSAPPGRLPESADLVVATAHWPLVREELDGLAVDPDSCGPLGLTKVTLPDVHRAANLFVEELRPPVLLPGVNSVLMPSSALDEVLAGLRVRLSRRHSGWFPTLGKNRELVDGVGTPAVAQRDVGDREPQPAPAPSAGGTAPSDAGKGLTVGVIDTQVYLPPGIDPATRGFVNLQAADQLIPAPDELSPVWRAHCTFVTGLIHQYAPAARIQVRAVLTGDEGRALAWDVAKAIVSFGDVDVINLSLSCLTGDNQPPLVIQAAVNAVASRSVVVAAAGNYAVTEGAARDTPPGWPAALDQVDAIGSASSGGDRSRFSPDEPWVLTTECGENVVSTFLEGKVIGLGGDILGPFNGYATWSGTSFAAATVSGRLLALASQHGCSVQQARSLLDN